MWGKGEKKKIKEKKREKSRRDIWQETARLLDKIVSKILTIFFQFSNGYFSMFGFLAASLLVKVEQMIWQQPGGDYLKSFSKLFIRLSISLSNRQGDRQTFKTLKTLKGKKSLMTFL